MQLPVNYADIVPLFFGCDNTQAKFSQRKFLQPFGRPQAIDAFFGTQDQNKSRTIIRFHIGKVPLPVNRLATCRRTVNSVTTHRVEQFIAAATTTLARRFFPCSPPGN
jgi:hypothetical protein